jgi:hypothetical protein
MKVASFMKGVNETSTAAISIAVATLDLAAEDAVEAVDIAAAGMESIDKPTAPG